MTLDEFARLDPRERQAYFRIAAAEMGLPQQTIQKDFWVVWVLSKFFELDEELGPFTFKGGTSLSKCYDVISRFSEDIDIGVERKTIRDPDGEPFDDDTFFYGAPSVNQRAKRVAQLDAAVSAYLNERLAPRLRESIARVLGSTEWELVGGNKAGDLIFRYPNVGGVGTPQYMRPEVLIEFGTLDAWPHEICEIEPYVASVILRRSAIEQLRVRTLGIARTFWEKTVILHQYAHLPADRPFPREKSRHYYDVAMIGRSAYYANILSKIDLLSEVVMYKRLFYPLGYARYELASSPNSLVLVPPDRIRAELARDYKRMADEMLFPNPTRPPFAEIESEIARIQDTIRSLGRTTRGAVEGGLLS